MERHGETVLVRGASAPHGKEGERLLVNGQQMAMRLWEHEEVGATKPEHSNPYEYVAYIIAGALRVTIDGHTFEARTGDSFCVPAKSKSTLEILEKATVVEATCPSNRGDVTVVDE